MPFTPDRPHGARRGPLAASAPRGRETGAVDCAPPDAGLRPGTAQKIVWHDPQNRSRTDLGLVYFHGFSASRGEIAPVCDRLAARLGANLFYTRLAGHGRDGGALARATAARWMADAREAVAVGRRLGRRVAIFGTSTGGTLAVWAAAQPDLAPHIAALVLMSPNFGPRHPLAGLVQHPWLHPLAVRLIRGWRRFPAANPGHERVWTLAYPWRAVLPMLTLVHRVARIDPGRIRVPVLLFYHAGDRVVRIDRMRRFYQGLGGFKRRWRIARTGHPGRHILAGEIFAPAMTRPVAELAAAFLRRPECAVAGREAIDFNCQAGGPQ